MLRIGLIGAAGKMSSFIVEEIIKSDKATLSYALVRDDSPYLGQDVGVFFSHPPLGIFFDNNLEFWHKIDVAIDFSSADLSMEIARNCAIHHKVHIIGTTAISKKQVNILKKYAKECVIVFSFNMSFAVNLLAHLVKQAASVLGDEFDIEILEMHHREKKDAPSGTALMLGESAALGRGVSLEKSAVFSRTTNGKRQKGEIGFAAIRGGDTIFEHNVIFLANNERLELSHKANSRMVYAKGAMRAAYWAVAQKYGFYSMHDVLE